MTVRPRTGPYRMKLLELFNLLELKSSELQQLQTIMKDGSSTVVDVLTYLNNNGWNRLAGGAYSNVFTKSGSPYIIKLMSEGLDMRNLSHYRQALQWLRYSQKNYLSNPHLPKVYYIQTMQTDIPHDMRNKIDTDMRSKTGSVNKTEISNNIQTEAASSSTVYLVVMERLEVIGQAGYTRVLQQGDLRERAYMAASLLRYQTLDDDHQDTFKLYQMAKRIITQYVWEQNPDMEPRSLVWQDIKDVYKEAVSSGHTLAQALQLLDKVSTTAIPKDLHDENMMMRADGTLVINDPFVG
jgi:hypothetical protein